jgi:transketolase
MSHDSQLIQALKAKANVLRIHSIRSTTAAGSGHPTTCMSAAEIMAVLFFHEMKWDPQNAENPYNDHFVLSKGHGAPVLYAAWAEAGVFPVERLLTLREIDSKLEGHPTPKLPFVDVATGSLGQGLGAGVGLALNSRDLDKSNYRTYVLLGDGESAEGSVWEAAAMASYYKLNNLVAIVDVNRLGQSDPTALQHHTEIYRARFEAFGWGAVAVDGHNVEALLDALKKARQTPDKPFCIVACTYKGEGVSFLKDKEGWHGKPLNKEQAEQAIAEIEQAGVTSDYKLEITKPEKSGKIPVETKPAELSTYKMGESVATREAFGDALKRLGAARSNVVGLDADTKNSTFSDKFAKAYPNRFFECFIAEQNMVSVAAGLAAVDKIPFASTFAVFLSRGFDQVRMAGVSRSNIKLCGSHVGISIGEDGPSQMGLEDIALFRTIPGGVVFYPSDAVSAEAAVRLAAEHKGFAYIRTSRPKTPVIYENDADFQVGKARVVRKGDGDAITIATGGVTLFEALKAADTLKEEGIGVRVIDLFTIKPIDADALLKNASETGNLMLTVEDHYLEGGIGDAVASAISESAVRVYRMGVVGVPHSGPADALLAEFGIDARAIAERVREVCRNSK